MSNPNQKIVKIAPRTFNTEYVYTRRHLIAEVAAVNLLSKVGFIVWLYLSSNKDEREFDLSPKYICDRMNVGMTQCHKAIIELQEAGYLVQKGGNKYVFFETPNNMSLEQVEEYCAQAGI